jgi:hypothetical protein
MEKISVSDLTEAWTDKLPYIAWWRDLCSLVEISRVQWMPLQKYKWILDRTSAFIEPFAQHIDILQLQEFEKQAMSLVSAGVFRNVKTWLWDEMNGHRAKWPQLFEGTEPNTMPAFETLDKIATTLQELLRIEREDDEKRLEEARRLREQQQPKSPLNDSSDSDKSFRRLSSTSDSNHKQGSVQPETKTPSSPIPAPVLLPSDSALGSSDLAALGLQPATHGLYSSVANAAQAENKGKTELEVADGKGVKKQEDVAIPNPGPLVDLHTDAGYLDLGLDTISDSSAAIAKQNAARAKYRGSPFKGL